MRCEPLGRQEHPHAVGSEAEIGVEADGDTRKLCNPLHADENSGHEGGAIDGVMTDRQGLPGGAEDDLLVGDQPTMRTPCTRMPAGPIPP